MEHKDIINGLLDYLLKRRHDVDDLRKKYAKLDDFSSYEIMVARLNELDLVVEELKRLFDEVYKGDDTEENQ